MIDHLPECIYRDGNWHSLKPCICDRLRACEQRVTEGWYGVSNFTAGYDKGVQAARDAVALMPWSSDTWQAHDERTNALAAIDALRAEPYPSDTEAHSLLDMGRRIAQVRRQPSLSGDGVQGYDGDDAA